MSSTEVSTKVALSGFVPMIHVADVERAIEFVVKQQAQFATDLSNVSTDLQRVSADLQRATESHLRTEDDRGRRIKRATATRAGGRLYNLL